MDKNDMPEQPQSTDHSGGPDLLGGEGEKKVVPAVRTYETDVIRAVKKGGLTKRDIALSAARRRQQEEEEAIRQERSEAAKEERKSARKAAFKYYAMIAGIVFVLALASTVAYLFFLAGKSNKGIVPLERNYVEAFIFVESQHPLDLTERSPSQALQEVTEYARGRDVPLGTIEYALPVERRTITTDNGEGLVVSVLSASEFFDKLGLAIPSKLKRQLGARFTYGLFSGASTSGILVFKTGTYSTTFSELLAWEDEITEVLYPILEGADAPKEFIFETLSPPKRRAWADEVTRNIDMRVLRGNDGDMIMAYAFLPDRETFVISTTEGALSEVLVRLQTALPTVQ